MSDRLVQLQTFDLYRFCEIIDHIVHEDYEKPSLEDYDNEDHYYIYRYLSSPKRSELFDFRDMHGVAFQKWSLLHIYLRFAIWEICRFDAGDRMKVLSEGLLIDHLFHSNGIGYSSAHWHAENDGSMRDMVSGIGQTDEFQKLMKSVVQQVFFVLFGNRNFLAAFSYRLANIARTQRTSEGTPFVCLPRAAIPQWVKKSVFLRDRGRCTNCLCDLTGLITNLKRENFDHMVPLAVGGINDVANIQLLCSKCNQSKGGKMIAPSDSHENWYST